MARVVVAGEGGLARAVSRSLAQSGHDLAADHDATASGLEGYERLVRAPRADVVIDCSLNDGPGVPGPDLARLAADTDAFMIFTSLADVFDGKSKRGNIESDETLPATEAGAARLRAEREVARSTPRHAIVRTSWPIGIGDDDRVASLLERGAATDTVEVDAHGSGSPTYAPHLADGLAQLVWRPAFGVLHAAAAGSASELQLARLAYRVARLPCVPIAADAPLDGRTDHQVLTTCRSDAPILPHWRVGVTAWVRELIGQERRSLR